MKSLKWGLGIFAVVSLAMVAGLVYHAVARDGGSGSWILAGVWFVGAVCVIGAALRSVATR